MRTKMYYCPLCDPIIPYPSKEALIAHLQREHNVPIYKAIELVEETTKSPKDMVF